MSLPIREYMEGMPVEIRTVSDDETMFNDGSKGRLTICAYNEGGFNFTSVDLEDLLQYVKESYPHLINKLTLE